MSQWAETERRTSEIGELLSQAWSLLRLRKATTEETAGVDLGATLGKSLERISGLLERMPTDSNAASIEERLILLKQLAQIRLEYGRLF
jgi:hypothetical protein